MKKMIYTAFVFVGLIQGAAELSPGLAVSVVATCYSAMPGTSHVYCVLPDKNSTEAACFDTASERYLYEKNLEGGGSTWARAFGLVSKDESHPDASCRYVDSQAMPSELHCILTDQNSNEKTCFNSPLYCTPLRLGSKKTACFENSRLLTEHVIQQRRKKCAGWELNEDARLEYAEKFAQSESRPLKNEALEGYIARFTKAASYATRVFTAFSAEEKDVYEPLSMKEFMSENGHFWDVPWKIQRYLLAVAIELEQHKPNDELLVSGLTPLDHAAQQKDADMIFWLWGKGARNAKHHDTRGYIEQDVIMRSSDPRSLAALREAINDGFNFPFYSLAWATDLDPELALKKIHTLTILSNPFCIPRNIVSMLPEGTPGEKAVKEYLLEKSDRLNCVKCTIL